MTLLTMCAEFFLTGLFAIGGGLATLPFLTQMSVRHPDWFTQEMLINMVAVSESTPGPIGVNMSTYVGFTVAGLAGAVLATLALVLPSLIVIMIIARVLEHYRNSPLVKTAFGAIRPAVTGLIAAAAFSMLKLVVFGASTLSWINVVLLAVLFVLTQLKYTKKLHPILFIAIGAVLGILLKLH